MFVTAARVICGDFAGDAAVVAVTTPAGLAVVHATHFASAFLLVTRHTEQSHVSLAFLNNSLKGTVFPIDAAPPSAEPTTKNKIY
jgi:hypothetical protein